MIAAEPFVGPQPQISTFIETNGIDQSAGQSIFFADVLKPYFTCQNVFNSNIPTQLHLVQSPACCKPNIPLCVLPYVVNIVVSQSFRILWRIGIMPKHLKAPLALDDVLSRSYTESSTLGAYP